MLPNELPALLCVGDVSTASSAPSVIVGVDVDVDMDVVWAVVVDDAASFGDQI